MLDQEARAVLTVVPPEVLGSQDEAWFQFVVENLADDSGSPRSWDDFAEAVRESPEANSFAQAVEIFTEEISRDTSSWPAVAMQLVQESVPELVTAYHEAVEAASSTEGEADGDEWTGLVAEGGDWSDWDGSDESWGQWRDWFYELAAARGEGVDSMAREQLGSLEELSLPEKIAGLEGLGFTISESTRVAAEGTGEQDLDQVWAELVAEGGDWSDWDGSDEGFAQWRDYLYGVAATHGATADETARQRLDALEDATLSGRIAGLQELGITVTGAQETLDGRQQEAQETVETLVTVHINDIIDGALAAIDVDPTVFGDIRPLLQVQLESVAESQPELFVGEGLDTLRSQLQEELERELQTAAAAMASAS